MYMRRCVVPFSNQGQYNRLLASPRASSRRHSTIHCRLTGRLGPSLSAVSPVSTKESVSRSALLVFGRALRDYGARRGFSDSVRRFGEDYLVNPHRLPDFTWPFFCLLEGLRRLKTFAIDSIHKSAHLAASRLSHNLHCAPQRVALQTTFRSYTHVDSTAWLFTVAQH